MNNSSFPSDQEADRPKGENHVRDDVGIDPAETGFQNGSAGDDFSDPDGHNKDSDILNGFADFVRKQPVLTLSVAFGLGLLATSLLTGRRS
jgi:hypothetical protein